MYFAFQSQFFYIWAHDLTVIPLDRWDMFVFLKWLSQGDEAVKKGL